MTYISLKEHHIQHKHELWLYKKLLVPQVVNHMNITIFNYVQSTEVCKQRFENIYIYIHVECKHLPYLYPMLYFDLASMSYPK